MADEYTRFSRLKLKDGTIINNCSCGYSNRELWCFLNDQSIFEAMQLFSDPSKFETVIFEFGIPINYTRLTYSGMTELITIDQRDTQTGVRIAGSRVEQIEEEIRTAPESEQESQTETK